MAALYDFQPINGRGEAQELAPLCEPAIVPSTFLTGMAVDVRDVCVRIVGWEQLAGIGGEMVERRIVTRLAMSDSTARELMGPLRRALARGGN